MKILLDAMGGDNAPEATIRGAIRASKEIDSEIVLIGKEDVIRNKIKEIYNKGLEEITDKITIQNTTIISDIVSPFIINILHSIIIL